MIRQRIIFIIFALILFVMPKAYGQTLQRAALSDFVSANISYKDGKYEEAIKEYEKVLKSGVESGALYYNLGNSYFKIGKIGKAILNYERARLLIPRDSDLNFNYRFAVSSLYNYAGNAEKKTIFNIFSRYLNNYTFGEIFLLVNIFIAIIFLLHILSLYLRSYPKINKVLLPLFLVLVVFGSFSLFIKLSSVSGMAVTIKSTKANFEPMEDSTRHFDLPEGAEVKVVKDEFDWLKIRRLDGKLGWVRADSIERISLRKNK